MRKLRITVCIFFVVSCVVFGGYVIKERMLADHTPPVITCKEDTVSVSVQAEESELLAGVKAEDNKDGDISKSVRISSMSHFIEKGKRTVKYVVFDEANQAATAEQTLVYTDYVSPKIYLTKPLRYTVNESMNVDFMENMTAEDCLDGDLTGRLSASWTDEAYGDVPGTYSVTAQVNNSAGDVRVLPLQVTLTSDEDRAEDRKYYPMLKEYIVYTKVGTPIDPAAYLTGVVQRKAEYLFGGEAELLGIGRESVIIQPQVDYAVPGVYPVDYTYTDINGVAAVTRLFVVVEE